MKEEDILDNHEILPYNLTAERLVLGSILTNRNTIVPVSQILTIDCFYLNLHKQIYKAALILYGKGQKINFVTITTWLQDNKILETKEELDTITDLLCEIIPTSELDEYITLVYEKYIRRCLVELGYQIVDYGFLTEQPLEILFKEIEKKFLKVSQKQQTKTFSGVAEILTNIILEIKERLKTSTLPGLTSSYFDLDAITQGFHNSDLIILAGRPSMGKTAFSLNLANNIAVNYKIGIAFFSLEMTKQQLLYRLLSTETNISHVRLRSGRITKNEWRKINDTVKNIANLKLYIDDTPNISVAEINFKLKKLKLEKQDDIGLVIIDYLQLLEENKKTENRVQELSKITRNLKKLSRELDVPIIVLSQLSRSVEARTNKRPMLSDLRESGCFLVNPKFNKTWIKLNKIQKFKILSWNGKNFNQQNLINSRYTGLKPIYILTTYLGRKLFITSNHKILTKVGWKRIDSLTKNISICINLFRNNSNNKWIFEKQKLIWDKIIKIDYLNVNKVYDFQIQNFPNYLSNGIILHNSIEQDADVVLMLYRDEYYNTDSLEKNIIEIIVAKHRNGPIGSAKLKFNSKYQRFSNIS
ncbi:unnamed protein product [Chrysoparadoxa australica]